MKDKSGREIQVGDLIVYGHALGRCAGLQYGKVLEVGKRVKVQGLNADFQGHFGTRLQRPGFLWYGDRILIIREDQIPQKHLEKIRGHHERT